MGRDKQLDLEDSDSLAQESAEHRLNSNYFQPVTGEHPHEAGHKDRQTDPDEDEAAEESSGG